MSKARVKKIEKWLDIMCTVDKYGRKPGLADVPLTRMSIEQILFKRHSWQEIQEGEKLLEKNWDMPEGTIEYLAEKKKLELIDRVIKEL